VFSNSSFLVTVSITVECNYDYNIVKVLPALSFNFCNTLRSLRLVIVRVYCYNELTNRFMLKPVGIQVAAHKKIVVSDVRY
jgi:hypothetical protein